MILFIAISAIFITTFFFVLITWFIDRYEKEPVWLLIIAFFWGAIPAVVLSLIFEIMFKFPAAEATSLVANLISSSITAPIVEETFKGIALVFLLLIFYKEFDDELDGIIYGAMIGFGFALTEDIFYFFSTLSVGGSGAGLLNVFFRNVVYGANHAYWTAIIGASIGYARLSKNKGEKIFIPFFAWMLAIILHSIHNAGMVLAGKTYCLTFFVDMLINGGGLILLIIIIIVVLKKERRWIKQAFENEMKVGLITKRQYIIFSSSMKRQSIRWKALRKGGVSEYRKLGKLFQCVTELSFKKHQLLIDEKNNKLEKEINKLKDKFIDCFNESEKWMKDK